MQLLMLLLLLLVAIGRIFFVIDSFIFSPFCSY
jgi:hypothetical protein